MGVQAGGIVDPRPPGNGAEGLPDRGFEVVEELPLEGDVRTRPDIAVAPRQVVTVERVDPVDQVAIAEVAPGPGEGPELRLVGIDRIGHMHEAGAAAPAIWSAWL